jgi:hypothetical protein
VLERPEAVLGGRGAPIGGGGGREDEEGEAGNTSAAARGLIDGSAAEVLAAGDIGKGLE